MGTSLFDWIDLIIFAYAHHYGKGYSNVDPTNSWFGRRFFFDNFLKGPVF
jgi:hypothetical protein